MTADSFDNFSYEPAHTHESEASRRYYWAVAIGLQDVDGLKVSSYLRDNVAKYVRGEQPLTQTGELIRAYHTSGEAPSSLEADLVSQRIAELLASKAFCLDALFLPYIHKYLFQDLDASIYHPGEFKHERMVKQEEFLMATVCCMLTLQPMKCRFGPRFLLKQAKTIKP